ncbi:transposase [Frankia sp. Hr75.2]|nr:transposase [Frankia sp. Hr75.2]
MVSAEVWTRLTLLIPARERRFRYPGRLPLDDRAALAGILWVLRNYVPWRELPSTLFGVSGVTCWRRLQDWVQAGAWPELREQLLAECDADGLLDLHRALVDSSHIHALKGAPRRSRPRSAAARGGRVGGDRAGDDRAGGPAHAGHRRAGEDPARGGLCAHGGRGDRGLREFGRRWRREQRQRTSWRARTRTASPTRSSRSRHRPRRGGHRAGPHLDGHHGRIRHLRLRLRHDLFLRRPGGRRARRHQHPGRPAADHRTGPHRPDRRQVDQPVATRPPHNRPGQGAGH